VGFFWSGGRGIGWVTSDMGRAGGRVGVDAGIDR